MVRRRDDEEEEEAESEAGAHATVSSSVVCDFNVKICVAAWYKMN